ncbi:MAG: murein hydrolase activator EnvC family protein, partial [Gammaproteobacteria bacterium]
ANKNARIATLNRDAERLEKVINSVSQDIAEVPSTLLDQVNFGKLRGKLPWPVTGKIVDSFGSSRADDGALKWEAVRIAAPAGTRVRAIAYGRVAYAGWLPFYGLVLMVDHGDGYLTVYGHNEALYKQVGDWVQAGDEIATVGTSGGQPTPLLYFQIRHHDHSLDPQRWCVQH